MALGESARADEGICTTESPHGAVTDSPNGLPPGPPNIALGGPPLDGGILRALESLVRTGENDENLGFAGSVGSGGGRTGFNGT